MTIAFFGKLREAIGSCLEIDPPAGVETLADLRVLLAQAHPVAAADLASPRLRAAVDDRMAVDGTSLAGARTVDFFPPVSGG